MSKRKRRGGAPDGGFILRDPKVTAAGWSDGVFDVTVEARVEVPVERIYATFSIDGGGAVEQIKRAQEQIEQAREAHKRAREKAIEKIAADLTGDVVSVIKGKSVGVSAMGKLYKEAVGAYQIKAYGSVFSSHGMWGGPAFLPPVERVDPLPRCAYLFGRTWAT